MAQLKGERARLLTEASPWEEGRTFKIRILSKSKHPQVTGVTLSFEGPVHQPKRPWLQHVK